MVFYYYYNKPSGVGLAGMRIMSDDATTSNVRMTDRILTTSERDLSSAQQQTRSFSSQQQQTKKIAQNLDWHQSILIVLYLSK